MDFGDRCCMILILQICNEPLHYFEFVKPIEDIIKRKNLEYASLHYRNLTEDVLSKSDKIIICGTSLKDNRFLDDINEFRWIRKFEKPILGICGGMHILGLIFDGSLKKQQEIGLMKVRFNREFLGMNGIRETYELHNYYVECENFDIYARSELCIQAVKHKKYPFYGVLFHPEVRNKDCIDFFSTQCI